MPFELHPDAPSGECRFCHHRALYVNVTCDNCGDRLAWADDVADQLGEACPHCQQPNVYARRSCSRCDELLPWHGCAAAVYHATHNVEREFKGTMWWLLLALCVAVGGTMGIMWMSGPPR